MDTRNTRARILGMALFAASLAVVAHPAQVQAQAAQTADAPTLTDERLTQYAKLHRAINEARDEFQAEKARVHDTDARERVRQAMDERLEALYTEHEMTKEEYDGITFLVSIDSEVRTRLEAILQSLSATQDDER